MTFEVYNTRYEHM